MRTFLALLLVAWLPCVAADPAARTLPNLDKEGLALAGHDPVAFFTLGAPVKGRADFESRFEGARYRFASRKHRELFEANPSKYAPQFGGWCAYGVSRGALAPIKVEAWQIVGGRLLMQKDEGIRDAFNKDPKGNLQKADENWPKLLEKKGH